MTAEFDEAMNIVRQQYAASEAGLDAVIVQLHEEYAINAEQRATIEDLRQQLAECQEPPVSSTTFGAYAQPQGLTAVNAFIAQVGPMTAQRTFYGAGSNFGRPGFGAELPSIETWGSFHSRNFQTGARPKHVDVAAAAIDPQVRAFARKVKTWMDANPEARVRFSYVAEPDVHMNDDLYVASYPSEAAAQEHVEAYLRVRSLFQDEGVVIPWYLCLTGSAMGDGDPRDPEWWWSPTYEFFGVDPYNFLTGPGWHNVDAQVQAAASFAEAHGVPLVIPEFGCVEQPADPQRRVLWIEHHAELFNELGVRVALWWNGIDNASTGKDLRLSGPSIDAYKELL